jgi:hypothetical protein
MSSTALFAALAFAAVQAFAAGLALQSSLSEGLTATAGASVHIVGDVRQH